LIFSAWAIEERNRDRGRKGIAMAEAEIIDVVHKNDGFKPIGKVEPVDGSVVRQIKKVMTILTATSGGFKSKYDKAVIYAKY
jgi:hypothetical protein